MRKLDLASGLSICWQHRVFMHHGCCPFCYLWAQGKEPSDKPPSA